MDQQYYCYRCTTEIVPNIQLCCPICGDGFIEAISTAIRTTNSTTQQSSSNSSTPNMTQAFPRSLSVSTTSHGDSEAPTVESNETTRPPRNPLLNVFRRLLERSIMSDGITLSSIAELEDFLTQVTSALDALGQPARPADLQLITTISMTAEGLQQQNSCSICLEPFGLEESLSSLPCSHIFHPSCIHQWFHERDTCPVCRRQLSGQQEADNPSSSQPPADSPHSTASVTLINASSTSDAENQNGMVSGTTEDENEIYSSLFSPVFQQRHSDNI